jgi:hypothetical protein
MPKAACANCHYFSRSFRGDNGVEHTLEIRNEHRKLALSGDLKWKSPMESLICFKGIWDEGVGIAKPLPDLIAENRKHRCFFFPYHAGMLLPTAEELQQDQQSRADDGRKYRLAIYALVVSILGLVAKILYDHW